MDHLQRQLRFMTCGSVDDGKSTLIGQLLVRSKNVFDDQFGDILDSQGVPQLNQLVDGLLSEREQGITIDVAHRYFSTERRKFIIFDTPGHEQYTRNMATAATGADLAIVLIDAVRGIREQTRRHCFIASLLGVKHLLLVVNKMDLVTYSEDVFLDICQEMSEYLRRLSFYDVQFMPLSAIEGENINTRSNKMSWYQGPPLIQYLENLYIESDVNLVDLRLPVQNVVRKGTERYYTGTIASGIMRAGQKLKVFPGNRTVTLESMLSGFQEIDEAAAGKAVAIKIREEWDISRGSIFVNPQNPIYEASVIDCKVVWMAESPLKEGQKILVRHHGRIIDARVDAVTYRIDLKSLRKKATDQLELNSVGRVKIALDQELFLDPYHLNKSMGSVVLIDPRNFRTCGAGTVSKILERAATATKSKDSPPVKVSYCHAEQAHQLAQEISRSSTDTVFNLLLLESQEVSGLVDFIEKTKKSFHGAPNRSLHFLLPLDAKNIFQ